MQLIIDFCSSTGNQEIYYVCHDNDHIIRTYLPKLPSAHFISLQKFSHYH